jgi:hypothetical protein
MLLAWTAVAFVLGALAAYHQSMRAGFVADDWDFLVLVDASRSIAVAFEPLVGRFFRPLVVLVYYANYQVFGLWPLPYHVTVVLLHGLNAWLLCHLTVRLTRGRRTLGVLSGLLFLVFAGHTEAVSWIGGVADTMLMPFAIGGLVLLDRALREPGALFHPSAHRTRAGDPGWPTAAGWLVLTAGLMAKETAVMLPALAAAYGGLYAWQLAGRDRWHAIRRTAVFVSVPAATVLAYLGMRAFLFGSAVGAYTDLSTSSGMFFRQVRAFILRAFLPPWSRLAIAWAHNRDLWLFAAGLVLLTVAIYRSRDRRPLLFAATATIIMLAPAFPLTISLNTTETERVVYIPTAFGVLLTVFAIDTLCGTSHRLRNGLVAVLIAAHAVTLQRFTNNWRQAGAAFSGIVQSFVESVNAHAPGDGGHIFILNLPDNLRGAYIFRRGFYEALRFTAPVLAERESAIIGVSSHTIWRVQEPVVVTQRGPMEFAVDVAPNIFLQTSPPARPFLYDFMAWSPQGYHLRFSDAVGRASVFRMSEGRIHHVADLHGPGAPFGVIDLPAGDATCEGRLRFSGWALDDDAVTRVTLSIESPSSDTVTLPDATWLPGARPDVAAAFRGFPNLSRVGWEAFVPCALVPSSGARVRVTVHDRQGHESALGYRSVRAGQ